jgi:LPS-assembly lipoprotein
MLNRVRTGRRWAALAMALLLLAGCGFHLRGSQGEFASIPPVFVRGGDPAALELSQMLRMAGAEVAPAPAQASLIVAVVDVRRERRVQSVGTRGRVQEYQLIYQLDWHGEDRAGRRVIAPETISLSRSFSFDETDVIAKSNEEEFLFRDMQRNAVMQIMRRIQVSEFSALEDAGEGAVEDSPRSAHEETP